MVRKLYDEDAYRTEFDAEVIDTAAAGDGAVWVTLSQTCFFPEEGGQSPDRGTINGLAVVDVQISGATIRHKVMLPAGGDSEAAGEGGRTTGGDGLVEGVALTGNSASATCRCTRESIFSRGLCTAGTAITTSAST